MVFLIEEITSDSDNKIEKLKSSEPCRKKIWKVLTDCITVDKFHEQKVTTQFDLEWSSGKR